MNKKILFVISLLVGLSLLTGCGTIQKVVKTDANPVTRTVNVNGNGVVTVAPDIAYITIGVHTEAEDVSEALASNTQQAQAVSDALGGLGIDKKDVQTTAFNVYPQQQYGTQGEMLGIKYVVDNSVYVTVRDLTKMGEILSLVVKSGANNISGIQFDVADRPKAMSEARKKAVEDAAAQAEALATATGAKLGQFQNLSVNSYSTPISPISLKSDAAYAQGTVPVSAGQLTITVDVNATYALE